MKSKIETWLHRIDTDVNSIQQYGDSLLKDLGSLLFTAQYAVYTDTPIDAALDKFIGLLESYEIGENKYQTFSDGYLSLGTVYRRLAALGFLEENEELESAIGEIALLSATQQLSLRNYDLLYGATGILHYLLHGGKQPGVARQCSEAYLHDLQQQVQELNGGTAWPDYYYKVREQGALAFNLGLAHGVPAILKALVTLYRHTPVASGEGIATLIRSTAAFLVHSANGTPGGASVYGNYLAPGAPEEVSRLAWCYGDLGIGIILYQAGRAIQDNAIAAYGEALVLKTTQRKTREQTQVMDAGLCHGSAGIAHIYNRMWHYTGKDVFKEATDFWIKETLNLAVHKEHAAGFKKYNPISKQYETDHGLLEGTAGVGLVLLSYLDGDFGWDHVLMLDDA